MKDYDLNLWKFLNPYGATEYQEIETVYPLPQPGDKWGPWFRHPTAAQEADGADCGPNGWHGMKRINAIYAPRNWWPWYCQARGVIGESSEKARVREIRLRRVNKRAFWRMIRLGWCKGADLMGANLRDANLRDANLTGADLRDANLTGANLRGAYLTGANLMGANLTGADLGGAYLTGANLTGANLTGADLMGADLRDANLTGANLRGAYLTGANLMGANLTGANLRGAIINQYTNMSDEQRKIIEAANETK